MSAHTGTSLSVAVQRTLDALGEGEPLTRDMLAKRTGLNPGEVEEAVLHLRHVQNALENRQIVMSDPGGSGTIRMRRARLTSLPKDVQDAMVKTVHYPFASREEEVLAHLRIRGAVSWDTAVPAGAGPVLGRLVDAGHVLRSGPDRYYLSEDAQLIADGALRLYPEVRESPGLDA